MDIVPCIEANSHIGTAKQIIADSQNEADSYNEPSSILKSVLNFELIRGTKKKF